MSKLKDFENEAKEIAENYRKGRNPESLKSIQPPPSPAEEGNLRAIRHGAFAEKYLSPLVRQKEEEILNLIGEAPYIMEVDRIIVRNLARCLARLERFDLYLDQVGDIVSASKKEKLNPVMAAYFTAIETARRHLDTLGLTPGARARLGYDLAKFEDFASRLAARKTSEK